MNIISADPAFNFKPRRKLKEMLERFSWLSKVVEEERGGGPKREQETVHHVEGEGGHL